MKHFVSLFSELNPILIKEMRQYFHNRILLCEMGLLLIAQLLAAIGFSFSGEENTGLGMMITAMCILAFCGMLLCGWGGMTRFGTERSCPDLDYSKITNLRPFTFIWGKFVASLVMVIFLYALCLPFMVVAYFFRGVDLLQGLLLAGIMLPLILLMSLMGLLLGSFGNKKLYAIYVLIFIFGMQILLGVFGFLSLSSSGIFIGSSVFYLILPIYVLCSLVGGIYLFCLCMASICSVSENRMRTFRIAWLSVMLCTNIIIPLLGWIISKFTVPEVLEVATGISFGMNMGNLSILFFIGCCERLESGSRVLAEAGKGFWGNKWSFITSSGGYGALGLACCGILLTVAEGALAVVVYDDPDITEILFLVSANFILSYFTVFGLVMILRKLWPTVKPGVLLFSVMIILAVLPIITGIAYNQTPYEEFFQDDLLSLNFTRLLGLAFMVSCLVELGCHYAKFRRDSHLSVKSPVVAVEPPSDELTNKQAAADEMLNLTTDFENKRIEVALATDFAGKLSEIQTAGAVAAGKSGAEQNGFFAAISGRGTIDFESLNCWSIKNLRQILHGRGVIYATIIALVLELWLILIWDRSSYRSGGVFITLAIIWTAFVSVSGISFAVKRRVTLLGGLDDSIRHFMDFMVLKPGEFFRGILFNYTLLFAGQMVLLLPMIILITANCNFKYQDIICGWLDGYLIGAFIIFIMGVGKKIRSDLFAVGIISFVVLIRLLDRITRNLTVETITILLFFITFYAAINCLDSWIDAAWKDNFGRRVFGLFSGIAGLLLLALCNSSPETDCFPGTYLVMVGIIVLAASSGGVLANPAQVRMALKERGCHKFKILLGCTVSPMGFVLPWVFFVLYVMLTRSDPNANSRALNLIVIFAITTIIAAAFSTIIGNSIAKFRRNEAAVNIMQVIFLFVIFFAFFINFSEQLSVANNMMYDCMLIVALIASIVAQVMQWKYYKMYLSPFGTEELK